MRNLFQIIQQLSKEDKRYFKLYLNRTHNNNSGKRIADLFDLVNSGVVKDESELRRRLYGSNKNAFYRLKNRLIEDIEHSLLALHHDIDSKVALMNQIALARIYHYKSLYREAFELLKRTERKAEQGEYHDLLNVIYEEILYQADSYKIIDVSHYLKKQIDNFDEYKKIMEMKQVLTQFRRQLEQSNYDKQGNAMNALLQEMQEELEQKSSEFQTIKMRFQINKTLRSIFLQKKDFLKLEKFLIANLEEFTTLHFFNRETHREKIIMFIWIINTLFKNRKFDDAIKYTQKLHDTLLEYDKAYYSIYLWSYYQSLIPSYFCNNQCKKMIEVLQVADKQLGKKINRIRHDRAFIERQLTVGYYCLGDIEKSLDCFARLLTKDMYRELSKTLQMRLAMVELMLRFDNADYNYVDYKLDEVRRIYRNLFKQGDFVREKELLKILKKCINQGQPFKQKNIILAVEKFIETSPPFELGKNELINYHIWLEAKLKRKNYYDVFLSYVKPIKSEINNN